MRSYKTPGGAHHPGNAVFSIMLSPGKVEDVKYGSGSDSLKAMEKQIAALKFGVEFPDAGPVHVYRRGMAVCEKVDWMQHRTATARQRTRRSIKRGRPNVSTEEFDRALRVPLVPCDPQQQSEDHHRYQREHRVEKHRTQPRLALLSPVF